MRKSADETPQEGKGSDRPPDAYGAEDEVLSPTERRIRQAIKEGQFDHLQGEGAPQQLPKLLPGADFNALVEQRIQKAMEDGLFDNLQGTGQPLDLYDDLYVPDDMKMAFRLMKAQGLKPPWLELRKEWEQEQARYRTWREELRGRWDKLSPLMRQKMREELQLRVGALNSLIHNINAMVPSDSLRIGLMVYERELRLVSGSH